MRFLSAVAKTIKLIWDLLKPIAVVTLVVVVLASALFAYDLYQTYQDRQLGALLIRQIDVKAECKDILTAGESFDLNFSIKNSADQQIYLEGFKIENSLLGIGKNTFLRFAASNPPAVEMKKQATDATFFQFKPVLKIKSGEQKPLNIKLKSTAKQTAGASSHTIVLYKGDISFLFNLGMVIRSACTLQVRYP